MNRLKKGFTIVELLVVVAIIALLIAILLPAIGKARDAALITQSQGNLRNLVSANAAYGADYNDRQYTSIPDDVGLYGVGINACGTYTARQCINGTILGWDSGGGLWGYWIRGTPARCSGYPGNCGNFEVLLPCYYWGDFFGTWRLCNCKNFSTYVNGRYYDPVFWAPKDKFTLENIQKYFSQPVEFNYDGTTIEFPTYCWSPAAMWGPDVLQDKTPGIDTNCTNSAAAPVQPGTGSCAGAGGFKSPTVGACQYPSLKTRMLEHQWLQNTEGGDTNPAFSTPTPWYFNQGYNSAPATMFFDGHIQMLGIDVVQRGNDLYTTNAAQASPAISTCGLWLTGARGGNGYYQEAAYDMLCAGSRGTSYHVLTTKGILGRDVMNTGE